MTLNNETQQDVLLRLKRANGHLNSVIRMVDRKEYCINIINQLKAVQAALDKASQVILYNHLKTCVHEAMISGDSNKVIDELMEVYKRGPVCNIDDELISNTNCCAKKEDNS